MISSRDLGHVLFVPWFTLVVMAIISILVYGLVRGKNIYCFQDSILLFC